MNRIIKLKSTLGYIAGHTAFIALLAVPITLITNWSLKSWESKEWNRQQLRQVQLRKAEHKQEVINELTKALAESSTAEHEMLRLFTDHLDADNLTQKESEHITGWEQSRKHWLLASRYLQQQLASYFDNPKIVSIFVDIAANKAKVHYYISNLPCDSSERIVTKEIKERLKQVYNKHGENNSGSILGTDSERGDNINKASELIDETSGRIEYLHKLMKEEIMSDFEGHS